MHPRLNIFPLIILTLCVCMLGKAQDAQTVRVAFYPEGANLTLLPDGTRSGAAVEWMERIAIQNNWNIEWIDTTYSLALKSVETGAIDIVPAVDLEAYNSRNIPLSHVITGFYHAYAFRYSPTPQIINANLQSFQDCTIGYVAEYAVAQIMRNHLERFGIKCHYKEYQQLHELEYSLISGDVDIAISEVTSVFQSMTVVMALPVIPTHFAISPLKTELHKQFDNAASEVLTIEPNLNYNLRTKYYPQVFENMVRLTAEEHLWLDMNVNDIEVPVEIYPAIHPYKNYDENGEFTGIFKNVLDEITTATGLVFSIHPPTTDADSRLEQLKNGSTLMWLSYGCDEEELRYLPEGTTVIGNLKIPQVICYRHGTKQTQNLEQAKLAVNMQDKERIMAYVKMGKANTLYLCESINECFNSLLNGKADYIITDYHTARDVTIKLDMSDKIDISSLDIPHYEPVLPVLISPAIDPTLKSIIKKSLESMTESHISQIITNITAENMAPIALSKEQIFNYCMSLTVVFLSIIALIAIYTGRRTKNALRESARSLKIADEAQCRLQAALEDAQQAARAKTSFLATMSHEIRTPLNAVIGFADFLGAPNLSETDQREYANGISKSAHALLQLLNDILDLSKLDSGRCETMLLNQGCTNLQKLFKELQSIFLLECTQKGIQLQVIISQDIPEVTLMESRLRQILLNLLGNAVKYTEKGSVSLECQASPSSKASCIDLKFLIKDTGIGISADNIKKIFDPFTQDIASRQGKVFQGTGLGLSIVKRLLEASGATIDVESTMGKGSVFTVVVKNVEPIAQSAQNQVNQQVDDDNTQLDILKSDRIIIVDDISINRRILGLTLKSLGITDVVEFSNGQEVIAYLQSNTAALVLTDLWMPIMNGDELAAKVFEINPDLPVVAITADNEISPSFDISKFREIIYKPTSAQKIREMLLRLHKQSQLRS